MKYLAILILMHGPGQSCAGCAPPPNPVDSQTAPVSVSNVEIVLTRASCVRAGAEYTLRIDHEGSVSYDGIQNVRVVGKRRAAISPDAVRTLFETFDKARYAELAKSGQACTSEPCTRISVRVGGTDTGLHDCMAPTSDTAHATYHVAVKELAAAVDEAAHSVRWTQDYSDSIDTGYTD